MIDKIFDALGENNYTTDDNKVEKGKIEDALQNDKPRKILVNNIFKMIKSEISSSEKQVSRIIETLAKQNSSENQKEAINQINSKWKKDINNILENIKDNTSVVEKILQEQDEIISKEIVQAIEENEMQNSINVRKQNFKNRLSTKIETASNSNLEDEEIEEVEEKSKIQKWIEDILK